MSLASLTTTGIEQQKMHEEVSESMQKEEEQSKAEQERENKRQQEAQRKQQQRAQQQRQKQLEEQQKKKEKQQEEKVRGELQRRIQHYRDSFPELMPIYKDLGKCTAEQLQEEVQSYEEQLSFPKAKSFLQTLWLSSLQGVEAYSVNTEYDLSGLTTVATQNLDKHEDLFNELACKYHDWLATKPETRLIAATVDMVVQVYRAKHAMKFMAQVDPQQVAQQFSDL